MRSLSGEIETRIPNAGTNSDVVVRFGFLTNTIIQHLNAIRFVGITCGIIAAACVVIMLAIKYSISANPINRHELKSWIIALIIGAIALGGVSAICVLMYNVGAGMANTG